MDCLVGYGSDEDYETDYRNRRRTGLPGGSGRRKEDDTNYDDVNMDMSEESQEEESEPELPQAEPDVPAHHEGRAHEDKYAKGTQRRSPEYRDDHRPSPNNRRDDYRSSSKNRNDYHRERDDRRERDDHRERDDRRRSPGRARGERDKRDKGDKSPKRDERRDDRRHRSERSRHEGSSSSRRGILGDKPDDKSSDNNKMPALMDLKPFGGEPPPSFSKSHDTRDAVSPRFVDRDRREKDKERERDRDRHNRKSEERSRRSEKRSRSRDRLDKTVDHRDRNFPPRPRPNYPPSIEPSEKHSSPSADFRPSTSYKVNKKLEVMEKMGLQIKTPDGSMATAQQLRQATIEPNAARAPLPYCNPTTTTARMLDQVHKRKLLWANKTADKAPWTGTTFAQDNDGKQANKFMRLMGIKEPVEAAPPKPEKVMDPNKKQEEMFQAMQAQYDVARATTHTMRGVGLGFQRGPF